MRWPRSIGIRCKLIAVFVLIKVLPLIVLAWVAWNGITILGHSVEDKVVQLSTESQGTITNISDMAVESSIRALDLKSRETIERLTTDTAIDVAEFLYARDNDILLASSLPPTEDSYKTFLTPLAGYITEPPVWVLNEAGDSWVPEDSVLPAETVIASRNSDNAKDFHSRLPDNSATRVKLPLFLEMTYVDVNGMELVKVTSSDILPNEKKNVSDTANTYCKAENYFSELKKLAPGEIYVSEVIGAYQKSPIIGAFTKARAMEKGIAFDPENAGYAGKENPVGKRYQGVVRWATPVVRDGRITGYVTLALDHTHIMEFTDYIIPTAERYTTISDASSGNYAFMWDYKDRNISHPRDYFITGYDPETGQPAIPWLSKGMFDDYEQSGLTISEWEETAPVLKDQSLKKKPSIELMDAGLVGLDCRYLNFAPQCDGWNNLTKNGGSGSFVILWSGIWKLTTAAAIPYHTGIYSGPRGFGFITVGANVNEFHKAATETGEKIAGVAAEFQATLKKQNDDTQQHLKLSQSKTSKEIMVSTLFMVVIVIFIAVFMASTLTNKITDMIKGIRKFKDGHLDSRLKEESSDEIGQLAHTFNEMTDDIQELIINLRQAEENYRGFFENATEGIFRTTVAGRLINVNPAFASLVGFGTPQELLDSVQDIGAHLYSDPERRKELLRKLEQDGSVRDFEYEVTLPSGESRFLTTYCQLVTGEDGEVYLEGMATDISERKLKEQAEIEKEAALSANESKSRFLATMSHEIRTPLNFIMGMPDILSETDLTGEQNKIVNMFKSAGEGLLRLINEILDFSKIEAGQIIIDETEFNLVELLDSVACIMSVKARTEGLIFECLVHKNTPRWVKGDELRVRQILMNLVGNAIKFTNEGLVKVEVSASFRDEQNVQVSFSVSDTGIGIGKEKIATVFESFTQADSSTTRQYGGTGLGLTISKRLLELMGGHIEVTSSLGDGTMFSFTLPFEVCHPVPEDEESVPAEVCITIDSGFKKVLIVEDSESNQMLIEHFLKDSGHTLLIADNGLDGLNMYKEEGDIDIILMDMQMPVMDGIDATMAVRAYEKEQNIPAVHIVALTANAFEDDKMRCFESGCDHFVAKPVRKKELLAAIGFGSEK
ncbi:ATP-binding protein [Maridesulfovibrio frigidus]|uniref:ATP-binding protein n=1 Tax=Maridesulfovibrio frigidus TaxID=340956 RepID=UPI00068A31BF|nr:ATP-binding protein [Maridesulfovibrio frigidus]